MNQVALNNVAPEKESHLNLSFTTVLMSAFLTSHRSKIFAAQLRSCLILKYKWMPKVLYVKV